MEVEKVKALIRALELGNMSSAATELGYTPSGISRMMASLEEETGVRLVNRNRNGISPTRECKQLLPSLTALVNSANHLEQNIAEICGVITGEVRVATAYSTYYKFLTDLIKDFCAEYPGIAVDLTAGRSSALMAELERDELDFCLISHRKGSCEWIHLLDDPFYIWVPSDHPAVADGVYDIHRIYNDSYIDLYPGRESDGSLMFKSYDINPRIRYKTSDAFAAYSMVEAGLGVTTVNGVSINQWNGNVTALPISPSYNVPIGIAVPETGRISPAAKKFRDFALVFFSEHKCGMMEIINDSDKK